MGGTSMKVRARVMGVVASSLLMVSALAIAQDGPPSGKVWVESRSVALGIGVSWGDGKLTFQGKEHVFSVKGLSVVDLGVSKVTANGEVFNLKKLTDFNGNYVAGKAGATVGGGAGAVVMQNQNGVVMKLTGTGQGIQLTLAGAGVDVQLKN
jgi:hypothetical protein